MDILHPLNDIASTKGKRKSSDGIIDENDENLKPSNSNKSNKEEINNKKVKVKDNIDTTDTDTPHKSNNSKEIKSAVKSTSRTALPRFVRKSRVSVARSPRALTKLSKKDSKGNVLMEITDSISSSTTTTQSALKQSTTSTKEDTESLLQRLNEYTVTSESQGIIRSYFNKAFTSSIDDITNIMNQTKTKSKW